MDKGKKGVNINKVTIKQFHPKKKKKRKKKKKKKRISQSDKVFSLKERDSHFPFRLSVFR